MGCNTSRDATVVDPSEKPEERPETAASTNEASVEENNGTTDKVEVEKIENSSWVPSSPLVLNSARSKNRDKWRETCEYLRFNEKDSQSTWKMFSNFDISADGVLFSLFSNSINATRTRYTSPIKESNLWPSHWGHFDTITSITRPPCLSEAIWHDKWAVCWLRWALCVCVAVCTDWPVRGEGGPVSRRRRRCTAVHQPLGQPEHTHTHTLLEIIQLFCSYSSNYFVINALIQTLRVVFLCTCVASIFLFQAPFRSLHSPHLSPAAYFASPLFVFTAVICSFCSEALAHLWSGLIVATHPFKRFQFCCRLKRQNPL